MRCYVIYSYNEVFAACSILARGIMSRGIAPPHRMKLDFLTELVKNGIDVGRKSQ
jgi:hypothetical protein